MLRLVLGAFASLILGTSFVNCASKTFKNSIELFDVSVSDGRLENGAPCNDKLQCSIWMSICIDLLDSPTLDSACLKDYYILGELTKEDNSFTFAKNQQYGEWYNPQKINLYTNKPQGFMFKCNIYESSNKLLIDKFDFPITFENESYIYYTHKKSNGGYTNLNFYWVNPKKSKKPTTTTSQPLTTTFVPLAETASTSLAVTTTNKKQTGIVTVTDTIGLELTTSYPTSVEGIETISNTAFTPIEGMQTNATTMDEAKLFTESSTIEIIPTNTEITTASSSSEFQKSQSTVFTSFSNETSTSTSQSGARSTGELSNVSATIPFLESTVYNNPILSTSSSFGEGTVTSPDEHYNTFTSESSIQVATVTNEAANVSESTNISKASEISSTITQVLRFTEEMPRETTNNNNQGLSTSSSLEEGSSSSPEEFRSTVTNEGSTLIYQNASNITAMLPFTEETPRETTNNNNQGLLTSSSLEEGSSSSPEEFRSTATNEGSTLIYQNASTITAILPFTEETPRESTNDNNQSLSTSSSSLGEGTPSSPEEFRGTATNEVSTLTYHSAVSSEPSFEVTATSIESENVSVTTQISETFQTRTGVSQMSPSPEEETTPFLLVNSTAKSTELYSFGYNGTEGTESMNQTVTAIENMATFPSMETVQPLSITFSTEISETVSSGITNQNEFTSISTFIANETTGTWLQANTETNGSELKSSTIIASMTETLVKNSTSTRTTEIPSFSVTASSENINATRLNSTPTVLENETALTEIATTLTLPEGFTKIVTIATNPSSNIESQLSTLSFLTSKETTSNETSESVIFTTESPTPNAIQQHSTTAAEEETPTGLETETFVTGNTSPSLSKESTENSASTESLASQQSQAQTGPISTVSVSISQPSLAYSFEYSTVTLTNTPEEHPQSATTTLAGLETSTPSHIESTTSGIGAESTLKTEKQPSTIKNQSEPTTLKLKTESSTTLRETTESATMNTEIKPSTKSETLQTTTMKIEVETSTARLETTTIFYKETTSLRSSSLSFHSSTPETISSSPSTSIELTTLSHTAFVSQSTEKTTRHHRRKTTSPPVTTKVFGEVKTTREITSSTLSVSSQPIPPYPTQIFQTFTPRTPLPIPPTQFPPVQSSTVSPYVAQFPSEIPRMPGEIPKMPGQFPNMPGQTTFQPSVVTLIANRPTTYLTSYSSTTNTNVKPVDYGQVTKSSTSLYVAPQNNLFGNSTSSGRCKNGGTFVSYYGRCLCIEGFYGDDCEKPTCDEIGTKILESNKCHCKIGYIGKLCQLFHPETCADYVANNMRPWLGVKTIFVKADDGSKYSLNVFCQYDAMVVQSHFDNTVNFAETWKNYEEGFGHLPEGDFSKTDWNNKNNFWIGLKHLHHITSNSKSQMSIRFQFLKCDPSQFIATGYKQIRVGGLKTNYTLTLSGYIPGNKWGLKPAGDISKLLHGSQFSTFDHDSSAGCSKEYDNSGFWFNTRFCKNRKNLVPNLNGVFRVNCKDSLALTSGAGGVLWPPLTGNNRKTHSTLDYTMIELIPSQ